MKVGSGLAWPCRLPVVCLCACSWLSLWAGDSAQASISTITLTNYGDDDLHVEVTIDDNTAGLLSFVVKILPTSDMPNTGDLFGVFLEFDPHPTLAASDFDGDDITAVDFDKIKVGGNNLSGPIKNLVGGTFDVVLTLLEAGSSSGLLTMTSFIMDDHGGGIKIDDLVGVGVRAQTVGPPPNGGGGSSKLYELYSSMPPPIEDSHSPEPASALVWLCLSALIASEGRVVRRAQAA